MTIPKRRRRSPDHPAARVQPVLFLLRQRFDYPKILRSPTEEVLSGFQAGGVSLKLLWYGFMLTAVLLAPDHPPTQDVRSPTEP